MMKQTQVRTAPEKIDAVNVVWRSHAARLMRKVCPYVEDTEVELGRLSFKQLMCDRLQGYVVFYTKMPRMLLSWKVRLALWWKERWQSQKYGYIVLLVVKCFRNDAGKPRQVIILPLDTLETEQKYNPGDCFRAVQNTEWRYAVRGEKDCEIVTEAFYRREQRAAAQRPDAKVI